MYTDLKSKYKCIFCNIVRLQEINVALLKCYPMFGEEHSNNIDNFKLFKLLAGFLIKSHLF